MINKSTAILYYLKYPETPILDYYIDVNGNEQYLIAGSTHEWVTGEKDSAGDTHTTVDADWTSLTKELEWKDQDKLEVASRILRMMGVNKDSVELFNYAQELKAEE